MSEHTRTGARALFSCDGLHRAHLHAVAVSAPFFTLTCILFAMLCINTWAEWGAHLHTEAASDLFWVYAPCVFGGGVVDQDRVVNN